MLLQAGLPVDGLGEQFPAAFVVANDGTELVGVAGLERYDSVGLLRSVAVAEHSRRRGFGKLLVQNRLRAAASMNMKRVFLLTTTAKTYFEQLGFTPTARADVPDALAASIEFARACPASATCLVYER